MAWKYNGVTGSIDAHAGYIGDVCGTNGADPGMSNADYRADLDAVNITARFAGNYASLYDIMNDYYSNIYSGEAGKTRADEFVENITWETLEEQQQDFEEHMKTKFFGEDCENPSDYPEIQAEYDEYIKVFKIFIKNLQRSNNEWVEYAL